MLAIAADRSLIPGRPQVAEAHDGVRALLIGDDGVARARTFGHVEDRPRPLRFRIDERREVLPDHRGDGVPVDVADDDHGHQIGPVPVAIEPHQLFALRRLDHGRDPNRRSVRIARSLQLHAAHLLGGAFAGAEVAAPFGEDDRALRSMAAGSKSAPPAQSSSTVSAMSRTPGRSVGHAQRVLRVVETGLRVRVLADAQAERRQEIVNAPSREMLRSLELHVLDKMRQSALVVVFQDRSGLHDQPELGLAGGLGVRPDVEAQAVRQPTDEHLWIDGHVGRERVICDRRRSGFAPGRSRGLRGQLAGGNEQTGHETGGVRQSKRKDLVMLG